MSAPHDFESLLAYMERLPAIDLPAGRKSIGHGSFENGNWWLKFTLDTAHPLAWRHIQELGHVLNYVSIESRLPTIFMPVSPPPYMNGGVEFLSWVIEPTEPTFTPAHCAEWLEADCHVQWTIWRNGRLMTIDSQAASTCMSIDTSGKWWVGSEPADMRGFLEAYASEGYEVHDFRLAKCKCGSDSFHLEADDNEGAAKRVCSKCAGEFFLCDSDEYWEEAEPERWKCVECASETTNVGVGFSLYDDDHEVRWLYVGCRCTKCGVLGCFAGWKIAYSPSRQLLDKV